jgi:hypothetical protein
MACNNKRAVDDDDFCVVHVEAISGELKAMVSS